ncbi:MAG: hypothetical protein F6K09_34445 [Merismopedia sp. SIO2A8]|nr:hypothetical protein [Merismopedia sp. SIO2A8]
MLGCLLLSGGDHLHSGTVVGKLEGDRAITLGFVDLMRDECVEQDRSRGLPVVCSSPKSGSPCLQSCP